MDGLAGFDAHDHGEFWAQGDAGLRDDGVPGYEVQPPALRNGRQREHALHPGEALSDALPSPASEGEVDEAGARGTGFGGMALGPEGERLVPELGRTMHDVLAEEEVGAGWDAEFVGVTGLVE